MLFVDGVVEYFGVEEEEGVMVVLGFDDLVKVCGCDGVFVYLYCEIDLLYLMGLGVFIIFFLEYN